MPTFKGRRFVITGTSRGLGLETAKLFLKEGAQVLGTAKDAGRLDAAAAELKALGDFTPFVADLNDAEAPKQIAEAAAKKFKGLDFLVNNAAVLNWHKDWMDEGPDQLVRDARINLFAPHALIFHLLPLLREGVDPRVINVSSGAGMRQQLEDSPDMPSYRLTKYALNGLTILWAGELKGQVAVNSLDPGWLRTDMGGPQAPGEPADGARRIYALASMAPGVTGKFYHGEQELSF